MTPAEFAPAIPASERPQTNTLYRAATGIGLLSYMYKDNKELLKLLKLRLQSYSLME
jgi:hypothetical protein